MKNKLASLIKARNVFEDFRQNMETDRDKSGAIKAFELCFELTWKTMQKILQKEGVQSSSPKGVFREAAALGLINNPKTWFTFVDKRNETVHTYKEEIRDDVLTIFDSFSHELNLFIKKAHEIK